MGQSLAFNRLNRVWNPTKWNVGPWARPTLAEEHIEGFWSAVDSVARERKYLAFLEGPPINSSREFVLGNIKGNWPHFIAFSDGQIIGWCDISALDRPVFAHIGSLGIGVLASYRGLGVGNKLMQMCIKKAE